LAVKVLDSTRHPLIVEVGVGVHLLEAESGDSDLAHWGSSLVLDINSRFLLELDV
jgi:hypothetical protein